MIWWIILWFVGFLLTMPLVVVHHKKMEPAYKINLHFVLINFALWWTFWIAALATIVYAGIGIIIEAIREKDD